MGNEQNVIETCELVIDNYVNFIAEITAKSDTHIDLTMYEVISWSGEDNAPCDREEYLKAYLKWDGCSHVWFQDDGYLHICGKRDFEAHVKAINWLYELAETHIARFSKEIAE